MGQREGRKDMGVLCGLRPHNTPNLPFHPGDFVESRETMVRVPGPLFLLIRIILITRLFIFPRIQLETHLLRIQLDP